MSTSAFDHFSPAYPGRAPWGTSNRLRAWQAAALEQYRDQAPRDFLAVATPGAGKTAFALRVAAELLSARVIQRITVVCPTEHLKTQWAEAAAKVGIQLDPGLGGSSRRGRSRQFHGTAVTYAGVAARVFHYRARTENFKTLVIFDEIHHAGDALSWGDAIAEAFEPATRRLALTGTPFRSDDTPIPFIRYERHNDGSLHSAPDFTYGYAQALRDQVVCPVLFMAYGGQMHWRTKMGDEVEADLAAPLTKDLSASAWRTALDPKGEWMSAVLGAADARLTQVRSHMPDAGGLVIASDQQLARAYAKILHQITGEPATLVLSDDAGSNERITEFSESQSRWMVAVRMVSEGVDVPRLAVGVYATSVSTPLFFAQAVGRFVRTRRRGETATVFLPTVPIILAHATLLERERDHVIGKPKNDEGDLWVPEEALIAQANAAEGASDDLLGSFEALGSHANFDHVLYDSQAYGLPAEATSQDEADYLGLPGLLEPDQVSALLKERQRKQLRRHDRADRRERVPEAQRLHKALESSRKQLNSLVSQYARSSGVPHSHVHAALRRACGGPELARCTTEQVDERTAMLRRWFMHPEARP
ncbi:DEAD/DEAH box helicase [Propionibacterium freudenreichii]|uniref:DEAD/DEAH box helicase n=1 Tax=Propionibacterium freudenreichii TaxID=1744 RepID=UPI00254F99A0|nr:DEAD/DEAH box helicase [Propionibacterium freudenreichii]MDK9650058.1 DEAD/DEAH box helicase [Propionibacterium freudenreichii]